MRPFIRARHLLVPRAVRLKMSFCGLRLGGILEMAGNETGWGMFCDHLLPPICFVCVIAGVMGLTKAE